MSYLNEMFSLSGQTAMITGGAGAIGTVMSEALLKAGANVAVLSRSQESIDQALEKLIDLDESAGEVIGICCDTGTEEAFEKVLAQTIDKFGSVEILINGVGGNIGKSDFVDTDIEMFEKVLHMNLVAGLMVPSKIVAKYWIDNKIKGSIINITSMASYNPLSGVWGYDAAKSATLNLTMGCANQFAEHGIRVNAIAPGFFIGKQNRDLLIDKETGDYTARGKAVIDHTPYGRFGDVKELAGATVFLACRQASGFVTGVSIPVDGGYLIHNI